MVEQVHQKAADGAGDAAEYGAHYDNQPHLKGAQPKVGGDDGGEEGDGVGVKMLEGVGADDGSCHYSVAGAPFLLSGSGGDIGYSQVPHLPFRNGVGGNAARLYTGHRVRESG